MTSPPRTTTATLFLLLVTTFFFVAITCAAVNSTPPHQKPLQLKIHHKHHHDDDHIHSKIKGNHTRWRQRQKMASPGVGHELLDDFGIILGSFFRDGEYNIYADIGSHKSSQIFSIDSASDEAWLQCEPCSGGCTPQVQEIYNPAHSTDSEKVLYTDQLCSQVQDTDQGENNECLYKIEYRDDSYTKGYMTRDKISWTDGDQEFFSAKIPIGCGEDNAGFQGLSGVLPLSRGPVSLVTSLNLHSLSYCLGHTGTNSYIIFNYTSPPEGENTIHLNLLRGVEQSESFLYVELSEIVVSGQVVPIPQGTFELRPDGSGGGVIFDTDSILTFLTIQAYALVEDAFNEHTLSLRPANPPPNTPYRKCFVETEGLTNSYPDITFNFQQGTYVQLHQGNFIINVGPGVECFAILPDLEEDISILGALFQRGIQFNYDFVQNDISMTFYQC